MLDFDSLTTKHTCNNYMNDTSLMLTKYDDTHDNYNKQQIPTKYVGGVYFSEHEHEITTEPPSIQIDYSSTDYFSLCGNNLKCDVSTGSIRCVIQNNSIHSAFAVQLITSRKIDRIIRIDKGHSIKIGICRKRMIAMDNIFTKLNMICFELLQFGASINV